jgi:eukaryotic-like serine/threonine-protein kinase
MDYLARQDAWEPNPTADDTAVAEDSTPVLLAVARATGRLRREDFLARRGAWIVGWEADIPAFFRSELWLHGYGRIVDSPESARDALDALPSYSPLPAVELKSFSRWGLGVAHLLAGRPAEAVPWLERGTRACRGLMAPYEHTRAYAWLGRAYQETGHEKGACAAYRVVLDRWGHGKARSVTAERVREWMRGLPCSRGGEGR